jgi:hypothetical protein
MFLEKGTANIVFYFSQYTNIFIALNFFDLQVIAVANNNNFIEFILPFWGTLYSENIQNLSVKSSMYLWPQMSVSY